MKNRNFVNSIKMKTIKNRYGHKSKIVDDQKGIIIWTEYGDHFRVIGEWSNPHAFDPEGGPYISKEMNLKDLGITDEDCFVENIELGNKEVKIFYKKEKQ